MTFVAVAMVEPQYHVNVGHVARLMKNFGLRDLYFIGPKFDSEEAIRYAMHGSDVLAQARTTTLKELREKFDCLVGTTAIGATSRLNVLREAVSADQLASIIESGSGKRFCLVLGREASGMKNAELAACDLVCIIETKTKYRTMNVAHALAILLYEISRLAPAPRRRRGKKSVELASRNDVEVLLQYVDKLADAGNFDSHKKPLLDAAVKKLAARSTPTAKDVMLLVSLLRKAQLAINRGSSRRRKSR